MSVVTHISKNLPNNLLINFPGFTETRSATAMDGIHIFHFPIQLTERVK